MDSHFINLIQDTYSRLKESSPDYALTFYQRLFDKAPELRPMFGDNIHQQAYKLDSAVMLVVNGLDHFDQLEPALHELGKRHVSYGVKPADFDVVAVTLIETLACELGSLSADERTAWENGLGAIAGVMLQAWDDNAVA